MARVELRNVGDQPIRVGDQTIDLGQTVRVEGKDLAIEEAKPEDVTPVEPSQDVFSPANRPNGVMTAAIAPKLPKSSGELAQFPLEEDPTRTVERGVAEIGVATQGGGPDSPDTLQTPGPKPENAQAGALPQGGFAGATGGGDQGANEKSVQAPPKRNEPVATGRQRGGTDRSATKRAGKARR